MSEEQPIVVRFAWTVDTYVAGRMMYRRYAVSGLSRGFPWVFFAATLVLAWQSFDPDEALGLLYPALFVLIGLVLLFVRGPLQVLLMRKRFAQGPSAGREIEFTVGPDGIVSRVEGISESKIAWAACRAAIVAPEGALVFLTPTQYAYLPTSGFSSAEDRLRVRDLIVANVPGTRVIG